MAGDIHITDGTTVATLTADLRDAGLRGVVLIDMVLMDMTLIDMVRRFGVVSKDAAPAEAFAEGSMEAPTAAAKNRSGHLTI
jgi:hypothetical protein